MQLPTNTSKLSLPSIQSFGGSQFGLPLEYIRSRKYLYLTVCTGNLLASSVGMAFAWSSPVLSKLMESKYLKVNPIGRLITKEEASLIGSSLLFGGTFGTFLAGYAANKIGRKKTMLTNCVFPYITAFIILAFAKSVPLYCFARFLAGTTLSSIYTVVPIYLVEIADDPVRGLVCSSMLTFDTFGQLIAYCIGPHLSIRWFSLTLACITTTFALVILLLVPESPYYLVSVKNKKAAEKSLMKLRSTTIEGVKSELDLLELLIEEVEQEEGTIRDLCKTKASRRAETITIGLVLFQQFSGLVPILIYAQSIFVESRSTFPPEIGPVIIGIVQFCFSFLPPNLVDRLGRKLMLLISATGMLISEICLGLYFYLKEKGRDMEDLVWAPATFLVTYIISYIMGFGPLIWAITGEIVSPNLKSAAFSVGVSLWWTTAFILSNVFYPLSATLGMARTFWVFGGCCFLAIIFVLIFVIETKGKSFHEIHELLNNSALC